jgi:hypothetical protein
MKLTTKLPEDTPWARLDRAFRTVIKVPKEAPLKEEAKVKQAKARRKREKAQEVS